MSRELLPHVAHFEIISPIGLCFSLTGLDQVLRF